MSAPLPPEPPFSTVTGALDWYVAAAPSIRDAAEAVRNEHRAFFMAGAVAGHTLVIVAPDRDVAHGVIEELRAWLINKRIIDGGLREMFHFWAAKMSHHVMPRSHERHAFYSGCAALVSLLNRGGAAGVPALRREVIELTHLIDPLAAPSGPAS